jgi:hypothetical protein
MPVHCVYCWLGAKFALMSSVHHPAEKKRLRYERDHRVRGGENDKAFRRKWPMKKRGANRALRRAAGARTRAAIVDAETETDIRVLKRRRLLKWGVANLKETVAEGLAKRARRYGAKKARQRKRRTFSHSRT